MQARLIEANVTQSCAPLEEVEALLIPLLEAWQGAQAAHQSDGEPNGEVEGEAAYALG
jgi:flagellin-specific chaperone FliS